jgi:hypothetical protein
MPSAAPRRGSNGPQPKIIIIIKVRGAGLLLDPLAITVEDDSAEAEMRYVTIGMNSFGSLMVVVG